jgi:hypothetical protein
VRHAFSQTPSSSHGLSRRQPVEGEGNSSGKNRHAAPVCRIHRMASKHARFDAQGRPRLSRRRLGGGAPSAPPVPTARRSTASAASSGRSSSANPPHSSVSGMRPNLFMKHALVIGSQFKI